MLYTKCLKIIFGDKCVMYWERKLKMRGFCAYLDVYCEGMVKYLLFKIFDIASYYFFPSSWPWTDTLSEKWVEFYPVQKNPSVFRIFQLWSAIAHEGYVVYIQTSVAQKQACLMDIAGRRNRFNQSLIIFSTSQLAKFDQIFFSKKTEIFLFLPNFAFL